MRLLTLTEKLNEINSYKNYKVGDVIDGSMLDELSGGQIGNSKHKYILVKQPLDKYNYTIDDLDKDYIEEEMDKIESMKKNFKDIPPIPEEGDGLHRIICAKEMGYKTILMWKRI